MAVIKNGFNVVVNYEGDDYRVVFNECGLYVNRIDSNEEVEIYYEDNDWLERLADIETDLYDAFVEMVDTSMADSIEYILTSTNYYNHVEDIKDMVDNYHTALNVIFNLPEEVLQ